MGLLDLLFPKSCLECKKQGKYICDNCLSKVKVINQFDPISKTFSVFRYEGVIRKAIIKIKYNFAHDIAQELAEVCAKNLNLPLTTNYLLHTTLIPIPLHQSRERWRGFNQSELLGKLIAKKLNWGFEKNLLIRPIEGKNQVGLAKSDRVRNIRGKFAVKTSLEPKLAYIIFDDVATTGSTIKEAIKVLKKSGVNKVVGLTVAR